MMLPSGRGIRLTSQIGNRSLPSPVWLQRKWLRLSHDLTVTDAGM